MLHCVFCLQVANTINCGSLLAQFHLGGSGGVEGWVVVGNAISLDVHHLFHDEPINEHLETSTFPLCKQITKTHLDIE